MLLCLVLYAHGQVRFLIFEKLVSSRNPSTGTFELSSKNKAGAVSCPAKGVFWEAAGLAIAMVSNAH